MKFLHCKSTVAIILCLTMLLGVVGCGSVNFAVNFIVDGEIYDSIRTNGSEMISLPKNPTKEGHRFVGWYWDEGEWKEPFTASSLLDAPLASSMNIYAYFKPISNTNDPSDNNDPSDDDNNNNNNNNNPPATVYNTPGEILDAAEKLADNTYLSNGHVYTLSGKIVSIVTAWSDQYSNISVLIAVDGTDGRTIECFRLSGEGAKELKVGDQITVKGAIKLYAAINDAGEVTSRKVEFERPELLSVTPGGTVDPTPGYEVPTEITAVDPIENTPYHFAMVQKNLGKTVYLTGAMDGYYLGTTENIAEAANVYIEPVPGFTIAEGFYIFFVVEGERVYLNVYKNGNYNNFDLSATPTSAFRYNDTVKTVWSSIDDVTVALGTDSAKEYSNVTIRYTDVSSFYVHFIASEKPNEPIPGGDDDPNPPIHTEMTIAEALTAADETPVIVKGTVTFINTPWYDGRGNMNVTISDGANTLYLYQLTTKVELGDEITVTGTITTYNNQRQIAKGSTAQITGHDDTVTVNYPTATIEEALASPDGTLVSISGTVTELNAAWDAGNGNMNITISDGTTEIYIYRLATKVELGDIITVKGAVGSYNSQKQIAEGSTAEITGHDDGVEEPEPTLPDIPDNSVTEPVPGIAYNLFLNQVTTGKTLFALSTTQDDANKFVNTTTDATGAAIFYVEAAEGGYKIYTVVGGKTLYLNATAVTASNGGITKALGFSETSDCVWYYKRNFNAWFVTIGGAEYVLGTYSTFETFFISEARFITSDNSGVSQFPGMFALAHTDPNPDPGPTIYQTPAEIMEAAKLLAPGAYLSEGHPYTLSGTVTSVDVEYDAVYNNISVTILVDGTTDSIQAFRLTGDAALLQSISIGDQITVEGPILMYQNNSTGIIKLEFEKPTLTAYTAGTGGGVDTPEINAVRPEIGTPYLFTLRQTNAGVITYFSGVMDQYYLGTTEDIDLAVNVYIEETAGGYYLYFIKDGVKRYINLAEVMNGEKLYINPKFEETPTTVYTYDEALGTLVGSAVEKQWIYGTSASGTYTNAAVREWSGDNIPLRFVASDKVDVIPDPDQPREVTIAEFIEIALAQPNRGDPTAEKYIIKGVITDLENLIYGNMTVTDGTGSIYVYGVYDSNGEFLYEDMSVKPRHGDTVTLLGVAGNYDRAQMQNGWVLEIIPCDDFVDDNVIYTTPEEIVNAAYALAPNLYLSKGLDYTLTGEIISIDTAYNETYGNISVVIAIEGLEDMPILCYRLSGAGVENLAVGDTITVKGPIKNYVQTDSATGAVTKQIVEFDKPTLEAHIPNEGGGTDDPDEVIIYNTPVEILEAASALASGEYLSDGHLYTMRGRVVQMSAYNTTYNNIDLVIEILDTGGLTIQCFRLSGEGADVIALNDIITVTGKIKNYNGTVEFDLPTLDSRMEYTELKVYIDINYGNSWIKQPVVYVGEVTWTFAEFCQKAFSDGATTAEVYEIYNVTVNGVAATDTTVIKSGDLVKLEPKTALGQPAEGEYLVTLAAQYPDYEQELGFVFFAPVDVNTLGALLETYVDTLGEVDMSLFTWTVNGVAADADTVLSANCEIIAVYKSEVMGPVIYETPEEILDAAAQLEADEYLSDGYLYTLSGVVTEVSAYNTQYNNINVTIEIDGTDGLTIYCFRLSGEKAEFLAIGDYITVTGRIKNYNGKVEFDCPALDRRVSAVQLKVHLDMNYGNYWLKQPLIYEDVTEITLAELYAISFQNGMTLEEMRSAYHITVGGVAAQDTTVLRAGDTLVISPKEFTPMTPEEGEYSVTFCARFPEMEREQGYILILPTGANTLESMLEACSDILGTVNMSIFTWTVNGEAATADTVLTDGCEILAVLGGTTVEA